MFNFRIMPGEVLEAYRVSGLEPARCGTLSEERACAIGVLWSLESDEDFATFGRLRDLVPDGPCRDYLDGFVAGFDGTQLGQHYQAREFARLGFQDGERVARAVFVEVRP